MYHFCNIFIKIDCVYLKVNYTFRMSKNASSATAAAAAAGSIVKVSDSIQLSYNAYDTDVVYTTDMINVSFKVSFGKGNDSALYKNESDLKQFNKSYEIETLETDDAESYYVIAEEGPIVIKIENPDIYSRYNNNCDYALGFAVDFEEPDYLEQSHITPFNIDRDGVMWSIPIQEPWKPNSSVFYQNGKAKYQWTTSRIKAMGEELTEDDKELGIEKTSENTGMMYLTFMVLSKEKEIVQEKEITRSCGMRSGGMRSGGMRSGGATRGGGDSEGDGGVSRSITRTIGEGSVAGRVGYGNSASTSSVASTFKYAKHTTRYVIPVRIRISKDSSVSDVNCSKTLVGAENNMKRKTVVVAPFLP